MSINDIGMLIVCGTNLLLAVLLCYVLVKSGYLARLLGIEDASSASLRSLGSEIGSINLDGVESALDSGMSLVAGIDGVSATDYPQWKHDHQAEITNLIAVRDSLEAELSDHKDKLARSHKIVTTLHAQMKQMGVEKEKLMKVRNNHIQLKSEITSLTDKHNRAQQELLDAQSQIHAAYLDLQEQRQRHHDEQESHLLLQEHLRKESEKLMQQLDNERAVLSRTLVEKEFIETEFIKTDETTSTQSTELTELRENYSILLQLFNDYKAKHPARTGDTVEAN